MQPFSTNQSHQQTFRYFSDSKRPLVVSFRRVNKVKLPNASEKNSERCNSICDIHRVVECDGNDSKMSLKNRRFSSYKIDSQMFHVDMSRQRPHFDNEDEESPQRDKRTITYPKEKFHGNAKLLFTINDDILKHNRHWYDSINATSNLFTAKTLSQKKKPRKTYYRNEIDMTCNRVDDGGGNTNKSRFVHKSTSTPSLSKLEKAHSNDIDIEMRERRRQCFVSIVNVRGNEKNLIKSSKSY